MSHSFGAHQLNSSRTCSTFDASHQYPPPPIAGADVQRNRINIGNRGRWLSVAALLLSVLTVTYSPNGSAGLLWDLYCKQSGVSNMNYTCRPADPSKWDFEGGIYTFQVNASGMETISALISSLETQINDKFDFCSPAVVRVVGDWTRFINVGGRESYYVGLSVEYGAMHQGSCVITGGVESIGSAEKSRTFSCLPGNAGSYLKDDAGSERFCAVAETSKSCKNSTPHPVTIADGEKHFSNLVDAPILRKFNFSRSYSSRPSYAGPGILNPQRELGFITGWRLSYEAAITHTTNTQETTDVYTVDIPGKGQFSYVEQTSGEMLAKQPDSGTLTRLSSGEFLFKDSSATQWLFDTDGILQGIHRPSGESISLEYDTQDRLSGATDNFGRTLQIQLNANGILDQVTTPNGEIFRYQFDDMGRLASVWTPDSTTNPYITYLHEDPNRHGVITGIIGADGVRTQSFSYNQDGRAIRTVMHGDGGAEIESYDLDFSSPYAITVTDPLGTARTYNYMNSTGGKRMVGVDQPGGSGCGAASSEISYHYSLGLKTSEKDFNGHQSCYDYDSTRRLMTTRIEGVPGSAYCYYYTPPGTALPTGAHKTTYQWHPQLPLKSKIAEPGRMITIVYNGQPDPFNGGAIASCAPANALQPDGSPIAVVCKRVKQATLDTNGSQGLNATIDTAVSPSSTTYSYNQFGQLLSIDGPRTDLSDITTFSYDTQGNRTSITNALGHTTQITAHDAHGRPLTIIDPNGVTTELTYDARGRLLTRTTDGQTTSMQYDAVGNLTRITQADGSYIEYIYDAADRLVGIRDTLGNHIQYTLDAAGNRTKEEIFDPSDQLTKTYSSSYDALSRLREQIGAVSQTTGYEYDPEGNLTKRTDANNNPTTSAFDALNRLTETTDAMNGITQYSYDAQDNLISVTDPKGNTTSYSYDGLGNRTGQTSPDTGTTSYSYDEAGNLISRTDARGVVANYSYDALNRLIQTTYADGYSVNYSYDQGTIGRLTAISDPDSTLSYSYNTLGRLSQKGQGLDGLDLNTTYGYDGAGHLASLTYPSGAQLSYSYNSNGQLNAIRLNGRPLIRNITHQPFGPISGWQWAWRWVGGPIHSRSYDLDGQLSVHSIGPDQRTLSYDPVGNITAQQDSQDNLSYLYDELDRLINATGTTLSQQFQYDANGNRTQLQDGAQTINYSIDTASNRLLQVDSSNYQYDANGNLISDGSHSYQYDARNRLTGVDNGTTAQYLHNALGQRIRKQNSGNTTYFLYGEGGELLGEYDQSGNPIQEIIYLGGMPVVLKQDSTLYIIHPDHLGTPRIITDYNNQILWRWVSDPFGTTQADEDPDNDGTSLTFNLRFPGQYYDQETGLHYNYFRDYDPSTGRYVQSDPIGLGGGLNTYAYVKANPLSNVDPLGLRGSPYGSGGYGSAKDKDTYYDYADGPSPGTGLPPEDRNRCLSDECKTSFGECYEKCVSYWIPVENAGWACAAASLYGGTPGQSCAYYGGWVFFVMCDITCARYPCAMDGYK